MFAEAELCNMLSSLAKDEIETQRLIKAFLANDSIEICVEFINSVDKFSKLTPSGKWLLASKIPFKSLVSTVLTNKSCKCCTPIYDSLQSIGIMTRFIK
jgi:hypothetical protein